jgi:redox-sensitive bicupin YhaK (pirin superfamily)
MTPRFDVNAAPGHLIRRAHQISVAIFNAHLAAADVTPVQFAILNALQNKPGGGQIEGAGSGVRHSEFNHAEGEQTHFLQIWIEPNVTGIDPGYEQKTVPDSLKRGRLALVAAPDAAEHTVKIHADARLYAGLLDGAESAQLALNPARKAYVFVVRGRLQANGHALDAGDAALLQAESDLSLTQGDNAEVLVFDLAA